MKFLTKIELILNSLILMISRWSLAVLNKIIPNNILLLINSLNSKSKQLLPNLKDITKQIIIWFKNYFISLKEKIYKIKLQEKIKNIFEKFRQNSNKKTPHNKVKALIDLFTTPILWMGQWLKGLSSIQSVLLLCLTAASLLAGVLIISSGKKVVEKQMDGRSPASIQEGEKIEYDRPTYYKKQTRHVDVTNLRIPVFFANINQEKTLDIDFTATTSDRLTKKKLEKLELQLRDHLILNLEPVETRFPLEEEGKDILREKLIWEINEFLHDRGVKGNIIELEITYVLAN